jgi:uncharacterized membrane protein YeaQ/YmgE (transglycosylase-associated protein family)
MHLLWTILVGFVIGALARWIKPGKDSLGFFMTSLIGIGGALLAKYIGQQLDWYGPNDSASLLASIGGAIVLLILYELLHRPLRHRRESSEAGDGK